MGPADERALICSVGTEVLLSLRSVPFLTGYYSALELWQESGFLTDADAPSLQAPRWIRHGYKFYTYSLRMRIRILSLLSRPHTAHTCR